MPTNSPFDFEEANQYYDDVENAKFACTDVTYLDGRLYVVTGYCDGDFCLTLSKIYLFDCVRVLHFTSMHSFFIHHIYELLNNKSALLFPWRIIG